MIKDELREYIIYNEILSNLELSTLVFACSTFLICISYNTIDPNLTVPFILGFITFVLLTVVDYIKR